MRKFAMLVSFGTVLAIGSTGFVPGSMPVPHAYPTSPIDPW